MQIILNNWTWQTINTYLYWKFKKLNSTIRIYKVLYKICHLIQSIKRLFSIIIYYLFINVIVMYNRINSKLQSFIFSVHDFSVTRNIIYIHWKKYSNISYVTNVSCVDTFMCTLHTVTRSCIDCSNSTNHVAI